MVKLVERKDSKPKGVKFVYNSSDFNEAEFVGFFTMEGMRVQKEVLHKNKPEEFLWALSPKNRHGTPNKNNEITSHEIMINGEVKYWFSYK